ncbi:MAG: PadR family transcriptional regulator [Actinobacteria bacterium]|nr:PadR family transcriptional regulator [Actinomycetota bacterium]
MEATQLLKGVLDAAVLAVVQRDDGYGYDVVRRLRDAGLEEVGDASVYGTLRRLYAAGALSTYVVPSDDGPHRKYYSITPSGTELLAQQRLDWQRFSGILTELIMPSPGASLGSSSGIDTEPSSAAKGADA